MTGPISSSAPGVGATPTIQWLTFCGASAPGGNGTPAFTDTRYDRVFHAYLDSAETKARYRAAEHNDEACFFLSATYGFEARPHAERHDWRKVTVAGKRSLDFLRKSREANGLSAEVEFSAGLFDYYAVWIYQKYPWLRPHLLFFPGGDAQRGIQQLRHVTTRAFYTRKEAEFFLLSIPYGLAG